RGENRQVEAGGEDARAAGDRLRPGPLALGAVEGGVQTLEERERHGVHLAVVERDLGDVVRDPVANRVGHGAPALSIGGTVPPVNAKRAPVALGPARRASRGTCGASEAAFCAAEGVAGGLACDGVSTTRTSSRPQT